MMQLSDALEQIDGLIDLVSALVAENQPEASETAMRQLRDGMQAFAGLAQRFGQDQFSPENLQRMRRMSDRLTQMRGHLAKVSAINAQQLATLIPNQATATYGAGRQPGSAASVSRLYHISG